MAACTRRSGRDAQTGRRAGGWARKGGPAAEERRVYNASVHTPHSSRRRPAMANAESVAREMVDAINRNDMTRYRELLHSDYSYTGGDGQTQRGPDAGVAITQMYRTAFPDDMKLDVQKIHAAGDTAIVEFIGKGTHRGELAAVAPTGRKVEIPVIT